LFPFPVVWEKWIRGGVEGESAEVICYSTHSDIKLLF
jgi:hypothetical protein